MMVKVQVYKSHQFSSSVKVTLAIKMRIANLSFFPKVANVANECLVILCGSYFRTLQSRVRIPHDDRLINTHWNFGRFVSPFLKKEMIPS